jgi:hypothetical protein
MADLNAKEGRIFRITHIDNVPWILDHGLRCKSSKIQDPKFVPIGLADLIRKRASRPVEIKPGGLLGDYVPFYFTPWSIMMYNISTGYGDVKKQPNEKIVVMVSSVHRLIKMHLQVLFTSAHAYMQESEYFDDVNKLNRIDWALLQSRDFKKDPEDPGKQGRYQAEALVHRHVPIDALLGIGCYDLKAKAKLDAEINRRHLSLAVKTVAGWYF